MPTEMDEGARRWLLKTAKENYWRVAAWYEFDDLIQDGYMCYSRVIAKYETRQYVSPTGVVTNKSVRIRSRAHIMSLFKMIFSNHIHDLARVRTAELVEVLAFDVVDEAQADSPWDVLVPTNCDVCDYEKLIAEAPKVLQRVLRELLSDGADRRLSAAYRVFKSGRETVNDRLCRLAGLNPDEVDVATMLRSYLRA